MTRAGLRSAAGPAGATLHLTNGDSTAGTLREALSAAVLPWRDVLHVGPVPAGSESALRRARAAFLAGLGAHPASGVERELAARDRRLREHRGAFLLWFEADLYDQLQLAQILDALNRGSVPPDRIGLINVGEVRLEARFQGLGQLSAAQLRQLLPERVTLTAEVLALASAAWAALRRPEPTGLTQIATAQSPQLRFLAEAFQRLIQEYPGRTDGLSLTQRRLLLAVAGGADRAATAFRAASERERRPFLGDTVCLALIQELASGPRPLLEIQPAAESPGRASRLRLTQTGDMVLAGLVDDWEVNRRDRWIGGVHLSSDLPTWRYDERLETLLRSA